MNDNNKYLQEQYNFNKKRMIGNGPFCGAVGISSLFIAPPLAVIPFGVWALRLHWISQNNKKIQEHLDKEKPMVKTLNRK